MKRMPRNYYKAIIAKRSDKWKDKVIHDYFKKSKRAAFDLNDFVNDKIEDYNDIESEKEAILKKCFHEFFLKHPNFKKNIAGVI